MDLSCNHDDRRCSMWVLIVLWLRLIAMYSKRYQRQQQSPHSMNPSREMSPNLYFFFQKQNAIYFSLVSVIQCYRQKGFLCGSKDHKAHRKKSKLLYTWVQLYANSNDATDLDICVSGGRVRANVGKSFFRDVSWRVQNFTSASIKRNNRIKNGWSPTQSELCINVKADEENGRDNCKENIIEMNWNKQYILVYDEQCKSSTSPVQMMQKNWLALFHLFFRRCWKNNW